MRSHKLRIAVSVVLPIMILTPSCSYNLFSHSLAQCLAPDLCVRFRPLLDEGSMMTIRVVTNLITVEDQAHSSLLLGVLAEVWNEPPQISAADLTLECFLAFDLSFVIVTCCPCIFCLKSYLRVFLVDQSLWKLSLRNPQKTVVFLADNLHLVLSLWGTPIKDFGIRIDLIQVWIVLE